MGNLSEESEERLGDYGENPDPPEPTLESIVRGGAERLDHYLPGWADQISLDTLDMCDWKRCVLGQLYGDYDKGLEAIGLVSGYLFGFNVRPWPDNRAHEPLWRAEILARRSEA
jgi:hypothetical protein